jgi:thiol-disulfide isomerase/thioredoxin
MHRLNLACGALLMGALLAGCVQGAKPQAAAQLAPHPLAGAPAAPPATAPRLAAAAPPDSVAAAVPPPPAAPQPEADGADAQSQSGQDEMNIPPDAQAQMEQDGLKEVAKQLAKAPRAAKDFTFTGFDGQAGKLSTHFGRPLVVNFWAVWCPWCVYEMPDIQAVYSARPGQFDLIGVCSDDSQNPPGFVKQHGFTWDFVYDKTGGQTYQIQGIPRTLFINRKGQVVVDYVGAIPRKAFEKALDSIV